MALKIWILFGILSSTLGFDNTKRSIIPDAVHVPCSPKDTTEPLIPKSDFEIYDPTCIPVKRCGGCCRDHKKECVAMATVKKQVKVNMTDYMNGGIQTKHIVDYEDHTACICSCKRKASDCLPTQKIDEHTCQCICKSKPVQCPSGKKWSTLVCGCVCDGLPSCPTGFKWNEETCKCDKLHYPTCNSGRSLNSTTCLCN